MVKQQEQEQGPCSNWLVLGGSGSLIIHTTACNMVTREGKKPSKPSIIVLGVEFDFYKLVHSITMVILKDMNLFSTHLGENEIHVK